MAVVRTTHTAEPLSSHLPAQSSNPPPSRPYSLGKLLHAPQNPAQESPPQRQNSKWGKPERGQRLERPRNHDDGFLQLRALPLAHRLI